MIQAPFFSDVSVILKQHAAPHDRSTVRECRLGNMTSTHPLEFQQLTTTVKFGAFMSIHGVPAPGENAIFASGTLHNGTRRPV